MKRWESTRHRRLLVLLVIVTLLVSLIVFRRSPKSSTGIAVTNPPAMARPSRMDAVFIITFLLSLPTDYSKKD
jgi:hypothetical protein